jgi:hypothetical protein
VAIDTGWIHGRFPVDAAELDAGEFASGTSSSLRLGVTLLLPEALTTDVDLMLRTGWRASNYRFATSSGRPFYTFDPERNTEVLVEREYIHHAEFQAAEIEGVGNWRIAGGLGLGAGVAAGYRFASTFTQQEHLLGSERYSYSFADGRTIREMTATTHELQPLSLSLIGSVSYCLPLGEKLLLLVEPSFRYDLLPSTGDFHRDDLAVGAGLSLLYDVAPSLSLSLPDPVLPPLAAIPIMEIAPPRRSPVSASVDLYAVDSGGTRQAVALIQVEEGRYSNTITLPHLIPFRQASVDLSRHYALVDVHSRESFQLDSLATMSDTAIRRQLLNMIGYVMRQQPEVRLAMAGSAGSGEAQSLASRRVKGVYDYLAGIWGIDTSRLAVVDPVTLGIGKGMAPGVYIRTSPAEGFDSTRAFATKHDVTSPQLRLEPAFQADAGLHGWQLVLGNEGKVIAAYSDQSRGDMGLDLRILYDRLPNDTSRLTATFTLTDSTGEAAAARAELPLVVRRSYRTVDRHLDLERGVEMVRIIQRPDSIERYDTIERKMMEAIEEWAHSGATVTLITPEIVPQSMDHLLEALRSNHSWTVKRRTLLSDEWAGLVESTGVKNEGRLVAVIIEQRLSIAP